MDIEVAYSREGMFFSQLKYVLISLRQAKHLVEICKAATTPIEPNQRLGEEKDDVVVDWLEDLFIYPTTGRI